MQALFAVAMIGVAVASLKRSRRDGDSVMTLVSTAGVVCWACLAMFP